jgi:hypothetical protein
VSAGRLPGGIISVGVLGAIAIYWMYRREGRGLTHRKRWSLIALRTGSLVLLLLMLSGVSLAVQRMGLPYLVVLVDSSASMGIVDQFRDPKLSEQVRRRFSKKNLSEASRLEIAKSVLLDPQSNLLRTIDSQYRLKIYAFDEAVAPLTPSGDPAIPATARRRDAPSALPATRFQ